MKFVKTEVGLLTSLPFHLLTADITDYLITQTHTPTNTTQTYILLLLLLLLFLFYMFIYIYILLTSKSFSITDNTFQYKHLDFLFYSLVI